MTTRVRKPHNNDLPIIAQAIKEYQTTTKTQKQCAEQFGVPLKLFSYYYLNGFKKAEKKGGNIIPNDSKPAGVRRSKLRDNNYNIVLENSEQQKIPQTNGIPNSSNPPLIQCGGKSNVPKQTKTANAPVLNMNNGTTGTGGIRKVDLTSFLM
jgi:hypothetical protein